MPDTIQRIFERKLKCRGKYSTELRTFALTLHFYSPKAYKYVRNTWGKLLPSISTLKQWYRVVDGEPGFTKESFDAIQLHSRSKEKTAIVNMVADEIHIRKQIIFDKKKFHGKVDIGTKLDAEEEDVDNFRPAEKALVFMVVSLDGSWKIPIGYFLISSLNGKERSNLLTRAFELLNDIDCKVYSITFDGASDNISMCTSLGAKFNYYHPDFQPYFTNPVTNEPCYVFLDLCHMVKLVRNTLDDKEKLTTTNGGTIEWSYLQKMYELQKKRRFKGSEQIVTKTHPLSKRSDECQTRNANVE